MSIDGRRALVTGSSSGIGAAIARHLIGDGWQVIGVDRAAATLTDPSFTPVLLDLGDDKALDLWLASLTKPDCWVHAAGLMHTAPLGSLKTASLQAMWSVHVAAAERLANHLLPAMTTAGWGRVVLIGSRVASGFPGRSQYAATKAALVAQARSWAAEVVTRGVTVNVVSPAATDTPMLTASQRAGSAPLPPPMGRLIEPGEVASLVGYLVGDAAAAITGQEIVICGGASLPRRSELS